MKRLLFILVLNVMQGCAGTFTGLCFVAPVGQTDSGITVVRAHCEAAE